MSAQIQKYSDLTPETSNSLLTTLNPENNNLYPSIVLSWSNADEQALFALSENWVLGYLSPMGMERFWCLSSTRPLSKPDLDEVLHIVTDIAPNTQQISNITPISLQASVEGLPIRIVNEDAGSYNYLYDVAEVTECQGSDFQSIRRHLKQFRQYDPDVRVWNFAELYEHQSEVHTLHHWWHAEAATDGAKMTDYEDAALAKLLEAFKEGPLDANSIVAVAVYAKSTLIGVSINEVLPGGFVLNHYFKSRSDYTNVGTFLFHETNARLSERDVCVFNYQEDLNIPGLQHFKTRMRPTRKAEQLKLILT
ncbi:MAG TPA: phosphatidylglycerol lysyltransferase domain-containing protein [Candidatus Saccharimonadales bacterium]|nr:phosphatidylglycerol lysyltransferase domain-containing protein [Candidatus Saccharimonadales bacterium]